MRLPLFKVHRAFRQLDAFSDDRCAGLVRRVTQRGRLRGWRSTAAGLALFIVPAGAWLAAYRPLVGRLYPATNWAIGRTEEWLEDIVVAGHIGGAPGFGLLVLFVTRDLWIRRGLARFVGRAACAGCSYSLLGLPVEAGAVRCPECGANTNLEESGLSAGDLAVLGPHSRRA